MPFVQNKLAQASVQSQGIFDLYVYEPENGDASTDVVATDYFQQSRYIGNDGWIDGIIMCKLNDGFFMMQVQSDGTTVSQVGAGGGEIPAIEQDIADLQDNCRGSSVIDMDNDDYSLTEEQAKNQIIFVQNTGDGTKTLTIPDFPTNPSRYFFINPFGNVFRIVSAVDNSVYAACYTRCDLAYSAISSILHTESITMAANNCSAVTTAANTDEQIIKTAIIPAGYLRDGESVVIKFSILKNGVATNETCRLRFGSANTTADTAIYSNATGLVTNDDNASTLIEIYRVNATTVIVSTLNSSYTPFGVIQNNFADITVADMDSNTMYLNLTGQNSTGAETCTFRTWQVQILRF